MVRKTFAWIDDSQYRFSLRIFHKFKDESSTTLQQNDSDIENCAQDKTFTDEKVASSLVLLLQLVILI